MGIPSYFSYVLKNNRDILKKLGQYGISVDNFYMDCNSVIYDTYYKLMKEQQIQNKVDFEKKLINGVCVKIEEYINTINPNKKTMICFDGVAPVAKLKQQKERRYKSSVEKAVSNYYKNILDQSTQKQDSNKQIQWDRAAITPGTQFMKNLGNGVKNYFYRNKNIVVSASDEVGEGEHKIFNDMRVNKSSISSDVNVVYGLDADLIMLAINHLPVCKKIYLYRETPEFIKSIDSGLEPNESYLMDIPTFAHELIYKLNNTRKISSKQEIYRKYDYMFICFMLGNDFMPHFPSINIRYGGADILTSVYSNLFSSTNKNITNGKKIYWGNFKKFVSELAANEHKYILDNYKIRENLERKNFNLKMDGTPHNDLIEEKMNKLLHMPVKRREIERYIDPKKEYWKERYYECLFGEKRSNDLLRRVCVNYLEGLEWTLNYYSSDCKHWKWKYNYSYPPLLCDLVKYIPTWECDMIDDSMIDELGENKPVNEMTQLGFVLPYNSMNLLPDKISNYVIHNNICKKSYDIHWSYCRYYWESHVNFDGVDFDEMEQDIQEILTTVN